MFIWSPLSNTGQSLTGLLGTCFRLAAGKASLSLEYEALCTRSVTGWVGLASGLDLTQPNAALCMACGKGMVEGLLPPELI